MVTPCQPERQRSQEGGDLPAARTSRTTVAAPGLGGMTYGTAGNMRADPGGLTLRTRTIGAASSYWHRTCAPSGVSALAEQ